MRRSLFSVTAVLIAGLVIMACGGGSSSGGGGASTLTIATSNTGTAATYTEGPINDYHYYDPSFSGDCDTTAGMLITMCSGVTGSDTNPCNVSINIKTSGMTPEGYIVSGETTSTSTYILYTNPQGQHYHSIASKGTITLTSVGNVGQPITGSFDAVLELWTIQTTTMGVSGTFSVIRDH